ncbi:MAG: CRISPR-associated helicase Cas3' [Clostridiales Family XIII bacterium]|jgi:CRISPR-associated helicase Cas3/CRISPR-associated endonuclease Cas3-HD|nr:CRISPR-associated helicase Cas3' [Clostridiales Family XIII bacterium]
MNDYKPIAHTKDGKTFVSEADSQLLSDHLKNVSELASNFASEFDAAQIGQMIGAIHDYGKYTSDFQDRIRGRNIRVNHAIHGGKYLAKADDPLLKFYALLVASHHKGLFNYVDFSNIINNELTLPTVLDFELPDRSNCQHKNLGSFNGDKEMSFAFSIYLRMLFSCLVDADYTDTEEFCTGQKREKTIFNVDLFIEKLCKSIPLNNGSPINNIRSNILEMCKAESIKEQGVFSLTVPTGGGKTLSSLMFALLHAKKHSLRRIIYVIPYTSIIEQNAKVVSNILGSEYVLEHHSNSEIDNEDFRIRHATENWDIPIVFTTNVQFFESFFSNKPSKCRKLHNVANSIVIFDEVQSLPRAFLSPCMYLISELVGNYGVTAILMSATQPHIDKYMYEKCNAIEIISDPEKLANDLERTIFKYMGEQSDEDVISRVRKQKDSLIVVNSRKHANELYELLKTEIHGDIYCLTTLLTPQDRKSKIAEMKSKLAQGKAVFCVSTQLIEAGVDIDFSSVFRASAGIDSIIQAGGRCNREGKKTNSIVYVFKSTSDSGKIPVSLKPTEESMLEVMRAEIDPFRLAGISKYFDLVFFRYEEKGFLDEKRVLDEFELAAEKLNFKDVAEKFKIVEDNTYNIIIQHKCDDKQINQLRYGMITKDLIRELSKQSVNIYSHEYKKLMEDGAIEDIQGYYIMINENYYDDIKGLDIFSDENKNGMAYDI